MLYPDIIADLTSRYEGHEKVYLETGKPIVIRVELRDFRTFTEDMEKPYSPIVSEAMRETMVNLCNMIKETKIAYQQSNEISLLLDSGGEWALKDMQDIISLSSSMATAAFNGAFRKSTTKAFEKAKKDSAFSSYSPFILENAKLYESKYDTALFRSKAFIVPNERVIDYFVFRQQRALISSAEAINQITLSGYDLINSFSSELIAELCSDPQVKSQLESGKKFNPGDLNNYPTPFTRGVCAIKTDAWEVDYSIPLFNQERDYIEKLI